MADEPGGELGYAAGEMLHVWMPSYVVKRKSVESIRYGVSTFIVVVVLLNFLQSTIESRDLTEDGAR